jgi:chromate reductase
MTPPPRTDGEVLLIPGSLRRDSYTTRLLRAAAQLVPAPLVAREVDAVRSLPYYDADLDVSTNAAVADARAALAASAGVLIATPEYNGTIPGGLKNWYDWVTRPYREHVLIGKPVAVIGASTGARGGIGAVTWLRDSLGRGGAVVTGEPVAIPDAANQFDEHGRPRPEVLGQLRATVDALVALIRDDGGERQEGSR